jgi:glycosyltransferase involved in cell wall biosynthesis
VLAWKKAFNGQSNTVLVLKVRTSKRTRLVLRELEELLHPDKNVIFIDADYSEGEIAGLQHACDAFISLHRSEGYGLNIHEALLCGKITIATNWSANSEYGPAFPNYRGINYKLVPYRDWLAHYEEKRFCWAEADLNHAAAELRKAYAETMNDRQLSGC